MEGLIKILIIGPFPPPITGVSLANQVVLDNLPMLTNTQASSINTSYTNLKEDLGKFSVTKIFSSLKQYSNIFRILSVNTVYMTIGQTFLGVTKYLPYFLLAKISGKKIVIHIHGNHLWKEYAGLQGIKKKIFRRILSMSDKGIVLSNSLKKNLTPFLPDENIYVLENFAEEFLYKPVPDKNLTELRIVYLSNLMKEKGVLDLLEALLLLKNQGINFKAKVAGGMDSSMKRIIAKYFEQFPNNVTYHGVVYGEDKKQLLSWGNIFVFPTYYTMEGQPISVFEAMAMGNIILTTKHAGIPDIFENEINGFYIDKKSPKSIASNLLDINKNLKKYKSISEHNIQEAKEKYRVSIFISKLYSILIDTTCKN